MSRQICLSSSPTLCDLIGRPFFKGRNSEKLTALNEVATKKSCNLSQASIEPTHLTGIQIVHEWLKAYNANMYNKHKHSSAALYMMSGTVYIDGRLYMLFDGNVAYAADKLI